MRWKHCTRSKVQLRQRHADACQCGEGCRVCILHTSGLKGIQGLGSSEIIYPVLVRIEKLMPVEDSGCRLELCIHLRIRGFIDGHGEVREKNHGKQALDHGYGESNRDWIIRLRQSGQEECPPLMEKGQPYSLML